MSSAFVTQGTFARNGSLTASWMNQLYRNQGVNIQLEMQEHNNDGSHNAYEIPIAIGTITWNGAAYSVDGSSLNISGVSRLATGEIQVTVSGFTFNGLTPICIIQALDAPTALRPYVFNYSRVNDTTIEVNAFFLNNALGAGNSWAAVDSGFCLRIFAAPTPGASFPGKPNSIQSATALEYDDGNGLGLNDFVTNQGQMFSNLTIGHTATGAHNIRNVARQYAVVTFASGSAALLHNSAGISGISQFATGHYEITLSPNLSGNYQVFTNPLFEAIPFA